MLLQHDKITQFRKAIPKSYFPLYYNDSVEELVLVKLGYVMTQTNTIFVGTSSEDVSTDSSCLH